MGLTKVKKGFFSFLLILFILTNILLIFYFKLSYDREIGFLISNITKHIKTNYNVVLEKYDLIIKSDVTNLFSDYSIKESFEEINSDVVETKNRAVLNIFKKSLPTYNALSEKGLIVKDIYNLKERVLSFKNIDKSAKKMNENDLIYQAIKTRQIKEGYEYIDGRFVYTYNHPVIIRNNVVGGLVYGYSLYSIQSFLNRDDDYSYLLLVDFENMNENKDLMVKLYDDFPFFVENESLQNSQEKENVINKIFKNYDKDKKNEFYKKIKTLNSGGEVIKYGNTYYILVYDKIADINGKKLYLLGAKQENLVVNIKSRFKNYYIVGFLFSLIVFGSVLLFHKNRTKYLKTEKFLSQIVHFIKGGLLAYDNEYNIKFANNLVLSLFEDEEKLKKFIHEIDGKTSDQIIVKDRIFLIFRDSVFVEDIFDGHLVFLVDITENIKLQEKFKLAYEIFKNNLSGIVITDINGTIIDVNDSFTKITGYEKDEVVGKKPSILKSGFHDDEFYEKMWHSLNTTGKWEGEIWNKKKNNEIFPEYLSIFTIYDESQKPKYYVSSFIDITEIKQYEEKLEYIAYYNEVTKLPNKKFFIIKLKTFIQENKDKRIAVCYLDLDGFKKFLDKYGSDTANNIIHQISNRIMPQLKPRDIISHFDEDIFVFATVIDENDNLEDYLEKIQWSIFRPFTVNGEVWNFTSSIGVTIYPEDNEIPDELIRHAQQAMFNAKMKGKNKIVYYDTIMSKQIAIRKEKLALIENALSNDEFVLYLQPKADFTKKMIIGAETLVRWMHPTHGIIPPSEFIPYIQNSDIEIEFDKYIFRKSIDVLDKLMQNGINIKISINISPRALLNDNLINYVIELGKSVKTRDLMKFMEIEIVESTTIDNLDKAATILNEFTKIGFSISVDDFGTGYASLDYIKSLPIDTVKIDRTFVVDLLKDPTDLNISEVVILLAKAFNKDLIAEGVEDIKTASALYRLGCNVFQGYLISKPLSVDDFISKYNEINQNISFVNISDSYFKNKEQIEIYAAMSAFKELFFLIKSIDSVNFEKNKYDKTYFNVMSWLRNRGVSYFSKKNNYHILIDKMEKSRNILDKISKKDYPKDLFQEYINELDNIIKLIELEYEELIISQW